MLRQAQHTAFGLEVAKLPDLPDAHVRIADDITCFPICESFILNISCCLDSLTNSP